MDTTRFDQMREAIDAAQAAISDSAPLSSNRDAAKALMETFLHQFAGLVYLAGGDALYVPDKDYLSDDIDNAFHDAIEDYDNRQPRIENRQYSTLSHGIQGLRVAGANMGGW